MSRVPYVRTFQPTRSSRQIEQDWIDVEKVLRRALDLVVGAKEAEAELHDAAHWSAASGSVSPGRNGFSVSDLTGDVATSPAHGYMRRQLRVAADDIPELKRGLKRVEKTLDKMTGTLKRAIPTALDSNLREQLAHDDETAREYSRRHRRPA